MEKLIGLALCIIPFISVRGQDIRELKSALAFVFMLVLGLLAFYKGKIKPFGNKCALILVGFVWINIMMSPSSGIDFVGIQLMQFWAWKPFCYLLAFIMGIVAISSYEKEDINVKTVLNTMVWVGFIMSLLTIIQAWHLDQFFMSNGGVHAQWNLSGTLGHPTFVSSFIAMIIPLALFLKKKGIAITMIVTVIIIQSQVAIGAMVLSLAFYFACKGRKQLIYTIVCLIGISISIGAVAYLKPEYITSSGRINEWKRICKDINSPIRPNEPGEPEKYGKYPLTGRGLGSFYYTYHIIHSTKENPCRLFQAHNEYLEWTYNCGIIGVVLLLLSILYVFRENFRKNEYRTALLSSFACVMISAGGMFVLQLGAHAYFTAIIVGLLSNRSVEHVN